jgi:hypothetical protein
MEEEEVVKKPEPKKEHRKTIDIRKERSKRLEDFIKFVKADRFKMEKINRLDNDMAQD